MADESMVSRGVDEVVGNADVTATSSALPPSSSGDDTTDIERATNKSSEDTVSSHDDGAPTAATTTTTTAPSSPDVSSDAPTVLVRAQLIKGSHDVKSCVPPDQHCWLYNVCCEVPHGVDVSTLGGGIWTKKGAWLRVLSPFRANDKEGMQEYLTDLEREARACLEVRGAMVGEVRSCAPLANTMDEARAMVQTIQQRCESIRAAIVKEFEEADVRADVPLLRSIKYARKFCVAPTVHHERDDTAARAPLIDGDGSGGGGGGGVEESKEEDVAAVATEAAAPPSPPPPPPVAEFGSCARDAVPLTPASCDFLPALPTTEAPRVPRVSSRLRQADAKYVVIGLVDDAEREARMKKLEDEWNERHDDARMQWLIFTATEQVARVLVRAGVASARVKRFMRETGHPCESNACVRAVMKEEVYMLTPPRGLMPWQREAEADGEGAAASSSSSSSSTDAEEEAPVEERSAWDAFVDALATAPPPSPPQSSTVECGGGGCAAGDSSTADVPPPPSKGDVKPDSLSEEETRLVETLRAYMRKDDDLTPYEVGTLLMNIDVGREVQRAEVTPLVQRRGVTTRLFDTMGGTQADQEAWTRFYTTLRPCPNLPHTATPLFTIWAGFSTVDAALGWCKTKAKEVQNTWWQTLVVIPTYEWVDLSRGVPAGVKTVSRDDQVKRAMEKFTKPVEIASVPFSKL